MSTLSSSFRALIAIPHSKYTANGNLGIEKGMESR